MFTNIPNDEFITILDDGTYSNEMATVFRVTDERRAEIEAMSDSERREVCEAKQTNMFWFFMDNMDLLAPESRERLRAALAA